MHINQWPFWNFQLKNEATRANLNKNKRILKSQPFWNKVYSLVHSSVWFLFFFVFLQKLSIA